MNETRICPKCGTAMVDRTCGMCQAQAASRIPAPESSALPTMLETRPIGLVGLMPDARVRAGAAKPPMDAPPRESSTGQLSRSPSGKGGPAVSGLAPQFEDREPDDAPDAVLRTPWVVIVAAITLVLAAAGAAFWLFQGPGPNAIAPLPEEVALPTSLKLPPSATRPVLLTALDDLDALAARSQRQLLADHDGDPASLDRLLLPLAEIDRKVTAARKDLNPEERQVAVAVLRVARQLRTFISSYKGKLPDLDGTYARVARERISDARRLLLGSQASSVAK